jgi:hypothetical protein
MKKLTKGLNKVSNSDYHADKTRLSSSSLKILLESPERFYNEVILGQRENKESNAFDEGSFVHALILEPEIIAEEFAFFDGMRKAGKDWEDFKAANPGKVLLSKPQRTRCNYYWESYKRNKAAIALIKDGEAEHTICEDLKGIPLKVRTDYINVEKGYIADVKTSGFPVDIDSFRITIDQYKYQLSAALYCAIAKEHYGKDFDFYFIAIAKKEVDCQVYKISADMMRRGNQMMNKAISIYNKCKETGIWKRDEPNFDLCEEHDILEI